MASDDDRTSPGGVPPVAMTPPASLDEARRAAARPSGEASAPTALVPVPNPADADTLIDPRMSDVDEWGRSEHMRALARTALRPDLPQLVPRRVGGAREDPHRRRRPARGQPRRRHPVRRPGDHARHRDRARAPGVRPGRPPLQEHARSSARCGRALGGVVAHPDNAYRLLREQEQLVLVFPEGSKGPGKHYSERYRLRRFGRGGFVEIAMRAGVPIVPIAVVGAEESMPIVFKIHRRWRKALGLPYVPITANMLALGPLGLVAVLPGQVQAAGARSRPLRRAARPGPLLARAGSWTSPRASASRSRTRSTTCSASGGRSGSADVGRRVLVTGLGTFWGGRVAQALEADPTVDVIVGLDTREPTIELERTEYVRSDENYSILSRIVKATKVDTIVHTFLVVDSTQMQRRTMHEINVIGTMNLFAAASAAGQHGARRRREVVGARLRRRPRGPGVVPRGDARAPHPARTLVERSLVEVEGYVRDFAEDNPHVNVTLLRFSNVLGPDIVTPFSQALELPVVPSVFGFDPRFQFVHEDDVVRPILFVLDHHLPGIYNVAGDGLLPWSEVATICGKRTIPLPPVGHRRSAAPARGARPRPPRRAARPAPLRPRHRQPAPRSGPASSTATPRPARSRPSSRRSACAAPSATTSRPTATSATSRSSSATRPPSCATPSSAPREESPPRWQTLVPWTTSAPTCRTGSRPSR